MIKQNECNGLCKKDINFPGWLKAGLVIVGSAYIISKIDGNVHDNKWEFLLYVFFAWFLMTCLLFVITNFKV